MIDCITYFQLFLDTSNAEISFKATKKKKKENKEATNDQVNIFLPSWESYLECKWIQGNKLNRQEKKKKETTRNRTSIRMGD